MPSIKEKAKPRPYRLQVPGDGLASWWTLGRAILAFGKAVVYRLHVEGAEDISQAGNGLRLKHRGSTEVEEEDTGPWTYPGDEACAICENEPILEAKRTLLCGYARCCGDPITDEGFPYLEAAGKIITTQQCTLYDNTSGTLLLSECVRIQELDKDEDGDGSASGPCSEGMPACTGTTFTEEGCSDAPLCSGPPDPGFKCYVVNSQTTSYEKTCTYANLPLQALAAAIPETDSEFTITTIEDMVGQYSMVHEGQAVETSWEFRRRNGRKPMHIILGITERNAANGEDEVVSEEIISFDAATNSGFYTLESSGEGRIAIITAANVITGRLPP